MDAMTFHRAYTTRLSALLAQVPDAGLRVRLRRQADPYFRQCALGLWNGEGEAITQVHADLYAELYSQTPLAEPPLLWDLVNQAGQRTAPPQPPFLADLAAYDNTTGRQITRGILTPLGEILVLLAAAPQDALSQRSATLLQGYLDAITQWCGQNGLSPEGVPLPEYRPPQEEAPKEPDAGPGDFPLFSGGSFPLLPDPAPQGEQVAPEAAPQEEEAPPPTVEELLAELDELCGLEGVKAEVHSLINLVKVRRLREEADLPTPPLSLHMVFQGNPGTGKTTVARLLGGLYKAIGVLPQGQLIEVDRSGLVAGYVGQTAIKTQEVIQKAIGGILFIDEAYALTPDSPNDFGQEAIETILKAMEDHRKDLVVIVAGYTDLMGKFIHANPGLESRFNKYLTFDDYNGAQLLEIFHSLCKKNGYTLAPAAEEAAAQGFQTLYDNRDENFGNARQVRNVFEKAVAHQADRVAALEAPTKEALMEILEEDLTF